MENKLSLLVFISFALIYFALDVALLVAVDHIIICRPISCLPYFIYAGYGAVFHDNVMITIYLFLSCCMVI